MSDEDNEAPFTSAELATSPVSVFHDAATKRLDILIGADDALDSKAWSALSIGSAILPVTFGLLGLSNLDIPWMAWVFLGLAGASYGVLLAHAWMITSGTYRLRTGGPIAELRQHLESREYSGEGLLLWLAQEYDLAIRANEGSISKKATYVGRASYAVYLESALLTIAAIITLIFG